MSRIMGAIVRIASSILELLTIKERRKDRQERKDDADAPVQAAEEIRQAVAEGDEGKVNQLLEESRLHITHGGKAVSILLAGLTAWGAVTMSGCALPQGRPLVLSAERAVVKMEMNGVKGYFVPELQFADMAAAYRAEEARMKLREQTMEALDP